MVYAGLPVSSEHLFAALPVGAQSANFDPFWCQNVADSFCDRSFSRARSTSEHDYVVCIETDEESTLIVIPLGSLTFGAFGAFGARKLRGGRVLWL